MSHCASNATLPCEMLMSEYDVTFSLRRAGYKFSDIHTYIHACMHACMHAYIHTYIHTYMHACIHTYIHAYIHTVHK